MGLFSRKTGSAKNSKEQNTDSVEQFFDDNFREELRNHGRWYFSKVIKENGELFQKDLQATIADTKSSLNTLVKEQLDGVLVEIKDELKNRVITQLNAQLDEFGKNVKNAQDAALMAMTDSTNGLTKQHQEMAKSLEQGLDEQKKVLDNISEENKVRITAIADAQTAALQWINHSAQSLQDHDRQLTELLQKTIVEQQKMLMRSFETNMAKIVEYYILEAIGDEFDIKSQLPAIIEQLNSKKKVIMDDMSA